MRQVIDIAENPIFKIFAKSILKFCIWRVLREDDSSGAWYLAGQLPRHQHEILHDPVAIVAVDYHVPKPVN